MDNDVVAYKSFTLTRGKSIKIRGVGDFFEKRTILPLIIYIIFCVIIPLSFFVIPLSHTRVVAFAELAVYMASFFGGAWLAIRLSPPPILVIDNATGTLKESGLDMFQTELTNIKEVSVLEEEYAKEGSTLNRYRLEYTLLDGKKKSSFAFTSATKAEALIKLIRTASKRSIETSRELEGRGMLPTHIVLQAIVLVLPISFYVREVSKGIYLYGLFLLLNILLLLIPLGVWKWRKIAVYASFVLYAGILILLGSKVFFHLLPVAIAYVLGLAIFLIFLMYAWEIRNKWHLFR
jgi:hypothetical protein